MLSSGTVTLDLHLIDTESIQVYSNRAKHQDV